MKPQWVLQLPGAVVSAETVVHWAVFDDDGRLRASGDNTLATVRMAASTHFRDGETRVLIPGELVLLTSVRIPTKQLRHIKQALPYMVEEMIADNIEDVHIALPGGKLNWDGEVSVAVVRHHWLIDWLDQLYHHGIRPDFLGPDTLATPWREHSESYFVAPAHTQQGQPRVLYRNSEFGGQVVALDNLPVLLAVQASARADQIGAVARHVVSGGSDTSAGVQQAAAIVQQHVSAEAEIAPFAENSADVLAATSVRERDRMINLLQGGYRVQRRAQTGRVWARAAAVAGVGLALYALLAGGGGLYFSWRTQQTEDQTFALYRELFPSERRVISPRKQMANHLRGSGQPVAQSLLPLLAKAAAGISTDANTRIDELRFNQQQNNLQLQLRTTSLDALEQIKQRLDGNGLKAEINSSQEQGGSTVGRIQIREQKS